MKWRGSILWVWGPFLLLLLLLVPLHANGRDRAAESGILDWFFYLRGPQPPRPEIVLFGIDEDSFAEIRETWPWPRSYLAEAIRVLDELGAAVIGLDIILAEPSRELYREEDQELAAACAAHGNVVLLNKFENWETPQGDLIKRWIPPLDQFRRDEATRLPVADTGHGNWPYDADGAIRQAEPMKEHSRKWYHSFSFVMLRRYLGVEEADLEIVPGEFMRLGALTIPVNERDRFPINFAGPTRVTFPLIPFYRLVRGEVRREQVEGKIVIIGPAYIDAHDDYITPFYDQATKYRMYGMELHAHALHTMLGGTYLATPSWGWRWAGTAAFLLLVVGLCTRLPFLWAGLGSAVSAVVLVMIGYAAFAFHRLLLPVMLPIELGAFCFGGVICYRYVTEGREKRRIRETFSRFVSKDVVQQILSDPDGLKVGGQRQWVTVLFTDLRGFTTITEQNAPEQVIQWINGHFDAMTEILFKHHGTLVQYTGDGMMALFGAPVVREDHAARACRAALEMVATAHLMNAVGEEGRPVMNMGIGINTGEVLVGNVGSSLQVGFTALGDAVNTTARIQDLNKKYKTEILIGEGTYARIKGQFHVEPLEETYVKGKEIPVRLFELVGEKPQDRSPELASRQRKGAVEKAGTASGAAAVKAAD